MYRLNAEKIKERMQELGLSQNDMAQNKEFSLTTIKILMNRDTNVKESTAKKIAEALKLQWEVFLQDGYIIDRFVQLDCAKIQQACDEAAKEKLIAVFTKNLRVRTKQLGISREEIVGCTGLSRREVFKLMNGQVNPRITTVNCIAKILDATIDDLLTEDYAKTCIEQMRKDTL